jgi:tryptophan synthase alpha chain
MNSTRQTIINKGSKVLNVYFTAGFPELNSTPTIIKELEASGVDLIEVGIPYSDPLADGPTIQMSGSKALANGMTLAILFDQLESIKREIKTPLILMGYYNQMLQYGEEAFLAKCQQSGVSALIIPDIPMYTYEEQYKPLFEKYGIGMCFLITPATSDERIRQADELSCGFVYVISQTSITGATGPISDTQIAYFNRLKAMNLQSPILIGFGIHDKTTFDTACAHAQGAIVGSSFIRSLANGEAVKDIIGKII